jgi:uncharacterized protein (TIGR02246 family)
MNGCTKARIAFSVLMAFSPFCLVAQSTLSDDDSTEIRQVVAQFVDAFNRHDARGWAAPFTGDGDFTNVTGLTRHGRKQVEERFTTLFAGPLKDAHRTATIRHIRLIKPDVAAVDAEWELTGSRASDGSQNPVRKGMFTWVMVKEESNWKFADFHESEFAPSR